MVYCGKCFAVANVVLWHMVFHSKWSTVTNSVLWQMDLLLQMVYIGEWVIVANGLL